MNKNIKRIKRITVWLLCAVIVAACFTFAFAESDSDPASTEVNKGNLERAVQNIDTQVSSDGDGSEPEKQSILNEGGSTAKEPQIIKDTKPSAVDFNSFKDVSKHWAKDNLKKAVEDGLLNGFEDGTLRPDDKITLAQMITILVRILKPELTDYSGVPDGKWYTDAANKAAALGIFSSNDAEKINSAINRKSACAMIAEAFQLVSADPDKSNAAKYSDFGALSYEEKIVFASLVEGGYMQGFNGSLMLSNSITRAEFVTILYRIAGTYSSDGAIDSSGTVLSSEDTDLSGLNITGDLWIDATAKNVNISNTKAKNVVIRSDELDSITVKKSAIDRLVLAARSGAVDLNCSGIDTTVVGSGGGIVELEPNGNNVEITGSGRNVVINGMVNSLSVSGDNNKIYFEGNADACAIVINGDSNDITVNSDVDALRIYGCQNVVKGSGKISVATLYTHKSTISVAAGRTLDMVDEGIEGMTAVLSCPEAAYPAQYLIVSAAFENAPADTKKVDVTWTLNGDAVKSGTTELNSNTSIRLDYYVSGTVALPSTFEVGLSIKYTTNQGEVQTVTAKASIAADPETLKKQTAALAVIDTVYRGNRTTQWAIDHDYSKETKELFVNSKGYSSSSKYLIWVNIGTQHTMVFEGKQGSWKLIRSGLVSTGADDGTPRGVFKTTYKQSNWTTDGYTVKPVVRFYGGGYAFHSRLYYPGTSTLKGGANGVGYPLSHGCVRMQADDIEWLYKNIPDGTTVVVY